MALVVEDGTGRPDSQSFVSHSEAVAILSEIGLTFLADVTRGESLLARAARDIGIEFLFRGQLVKATQALAFPRVNLEDREGRVILGIPRLVKEANAELAHYLSTIDPLAPPRAAASQVQVGPIDIKLALPSAGERSSPIPDSVVRKLSVFGPSASANRRMRRISR